MRLFLIWAGLSLIADGQTRVPENRSVDEASNLPIQPVGPNDLIAVSVYDSPEFSRTVRVGADGLIRLPMLKERIKASGLYPAELETAIANALVTEDILVDPFVTVNIAEYQSRPISVAGSVKNPLVFQATQTVTVLEALARAGGLAPEAGNEILVTAKEPGEDGKPATLTRRVPVRDLIDHADSSLNFTLTGGEEIRVPEAEKIYVAGNVKKPGAFQVQDSGENTVLTFLSLAEGTLPFTNKEAYIYRKEASGNKNEIAIPIGKILDRKSPDVQLEANDILYVPDNKGKRATITTLDKIVTFGAATASGVLIYRH